MQSKTFIKAYVIIMTVLCLTLVTCLLYLSYQRGNDWTCNIAAFIMIIINSLVWLSWPAKDVVACNDIHSAFRLQQRIELKKRLRSLDVLN